MSYVSLSYDFPEPGLVFPAAGGGVEQGEGWPRGGQQVSVRALVWRR